MTLVFGTKNAVIFLDLKFEVCYFFGVDRKCSQMSIPVQIYTVCCYFYHSLGFLHYCLRCLLSRENLEFRVFSIVHLNIDNFLCTQPISTK